MAPAPSSARASTTEVRLSIAVSLADIEGLRDTLTRARLADFATIATPAILIAYLAFTNGGFDPTSRSVVGIAAWWAVLLAAAFNMLPATGGSVASRVIFGLAVAFAGWTALSLPWTDSDERTAAELARVSSYLAIFTLALMVQGAGRWRHLLHGVTIGIVFVCALAALSRMRPDWFPSRSRASSCRGSRSRGGSPTR